MKKYLVIGNPINHSLSPKLHNFWIKQNRINAIYDKEKLNPNQLEDLILKVRNRKIDGINLFDENIDKNNRDFFSYWTRKSPELYKNISLNSNNYKLVGNTDYDSEIENFELYDLVNDPTESKNLILEKNQLAMDMKNRMDDVYDELIKSKNLVNKPRIHLGSIYENPTILNRNDAGGQRGIWAQNEKYGLWRVNFQSGVYNFKFKFNC